MSATSVSDIAGHNKAGLMRPQGPGASFSACPPLARIRPNWTALKLNRRDERSGLPACSAVIGAHTPGLVTA